MYLVFSWLIESPIADADLMTSIIACSIARLDLLSPSRLHNQESPLIGKILFLGSNSRLPLCLLQRQVKVKTIQPISLPQSYIRWKHKKEICLNSDFFEVYKANQFRRHINFQIY